MTFLVWCRILLEIYFEPLSHIKFNVFNKFNGGRGAQKRFQVKMPQETDTTLAPFWLQKPLFPPRAVLIRAINLPEETPTTGEDRN